MESIKNSTTPLAYVGEVEITYKRGNISFTRKRHNAGAQELFRLIAKALTGQSIANECPAKLDLCAKVSGQYVSCLSNPIPLSGSYYDNSGSEWVYHTSAAIPAASLMVQIADTPYTDFRLFLLSRKEDRRLASLIVDKDDLEQIVPGTQALVSWTLKFQNVSGTQNDDV